MNFSLNKQRVKNQQSSGGKLVRVILSLVPFVLVIWFAFNWQATLDWFKLQTYKPTAQIMQFADVTGMSLRGRDLWYVSEPVIESADAFNQECDNNDEQSIVLGCYKMQKIYLFDVTDARLNGVEEVTAAHEMLHAAYERLSKSDRDKVNAMLQAQIDKITDERILELINLYNKTEQGQLYNEMHSILATEYRDLSPELENYYKQYFDNRIKTVSLAESYESVFSESEKRIAEMDTKLNEYLAQINASNATLESEYAALTMESNRLSTLYNQGNYSEYNAGVSGYNAQVGAYNTLVEQTQQLVDKHNNLVVERNSEATAKDKLNQNLDSKYKEVSQ